MPQQRASNRTIGGAVVEGMASTAAVFSAPPSVRRHMPGVAEAMAGDWRKVGQDMRAAIDTVACELSDGRAAAE